MKTSTRILSLLLTALLLLSLLIPMLVFAEEEIKITKSGNINSNFKFWGSEMVDYHFTYADGESATAHIGGFDLHYVGENLTSIVGSQIAYCIEPEASSVSGTTYTGSAAENSAYWNNKLTRQQRETIRIILLYGAPNTLKSNDNNTLFGMEGATQVLIWEIVMGLRSPVAPYTLLDARLKNHFYNNTAHPAIKSAYDSIVQKMQAHLTIPSFSSHFAGSAPTYTLNYDSGSGLYKCSLTDTNGVLSKDYDFSASGITFSKSGNTLNISAPASALAGGTVTASATGQSLSVDSLTQMIWTLPDKQTVTTFSASPDPAPCYFKLKIDSGTATIRKTSDEDDVNGYCFKIYKHTSNISWYGKSDSSGNVYVTDSSYTAGGTKVYTFSGLEDGTYTFLEVLSLKGKDLVFPDSWTITVTRGGTTRYDRTFTESDLARDANGDCRLASVNITGLTGGGTMTMTIHNAPEPGTLEVVKVSEDGKVGGISFNVEQYEPGGVGWWELGTYTTNSGGKFTITDLELGTRLRITEIVQTGYECTSDNPQTVTIAPGTNTVTFTNKPVSTLEIVKTCSDGRINDISFQVEQYEPGGIGWWTMGNYTTDASGTISVSNLQVGTQLRVTEIVPDGYVCSSTNPQTVTLSAGTNTLSFENEPLASLEIVKASPDGRINGISFKVEQYEPGGIGWWTMGTYTTDASGKIHISDLQVGDRLRVTEIVPEGYVCTSDNPQTVTLTHGTNTVTFTNKPNVKLEIVKTSVDGKISGISFRVEQWNGSGYAAVGTFTTNSSGKISIPDLQVNTRYRITETVPANYVCDNRIQTITTAAGTNTVTFVNHPVSSLEIVKASDDGNVYDISFLVEYWNGSAYETVGTYTTDSSGKIDVPDLQWNKQYRITETVPTNYVNDNRIQVITTVAGKNTVTFENHPVSSLEIIKTSEDGIVYDIEFKIERWNGSGYALLGYFSTDSGGKINVPNLEWNTRYRITETVPDNYVSENSVQEITTVLGKNTVTFENRLIRGSLKILKVDGANRTPLQGAEYCVYASDGSVAAQGSTDEHGELVFADLPYGNYTYREITAPEGFALDEIEYSFSILKDGAVIEVTRENRALPGCLAVYKVDEVGRPLSGVEFLLEYSTDDGGTWAPVQYRTEDEPLQAGFCTSSGLTDGKLITDEDGIASFTGLCINTQLGAVRYRITEIATKDGYSLLSDYAFDGSIPADGSLEIPITVVNQPVFSMPASGGRGFAPMIAIAAALSFAATILLLWKRRRQEE